jgi:hypothetical protein
MNESQISRILRQVAYSAGLNEWNETTEHLTNDELVELVLH